MTRVFRDIVPVNAPLLLYNGSAAYDLAERKLTFCHAIDLDLWEVVHRCEELFPDLTVEVQGIDAHYRFSDNPMWDAFSVHQNCAHAFAQPGDDLGNFLKFTLYGQFRSPVLADMFTGSEEECRRIDEVARNSGSFASNVSATEIGLYTVSGLMCENLNPLYHRFISER